MASFSCHVVGGAKQVRLERIVRGQLRLSALHPLQCCKSDIRRVVEKRRSFTALCFLDGTKRSPHEIYSGAQLFASERSPAPNDLWIQDASLVDMEMGAVADSFELVRDDL